MVSADDITMSCSNQCGIGPIILTLKLPASLNLEGRLEGRLEGSQKRDFKGAGGSLKGRFRGVFLYDP